MAANTSGTYQLFGPLTCIHYTHPQIPLWCASVAVVQASHWPVLCLLTLVLTWQLPVFQLPGA